MVRNSKGLWRLSAARRFVRSSAWALVSAVVLGVVGAMFPRIGLGMIVAGGVIALSRFVRLQDVFSSRDRLMTGRLDRLASGLGEKIAHFRAASQQDAGAPRGAL